MQIATNSYAVVAYRLSDETGALLEDSEKGEPITYVHGYGMLVPGLEAGLLGLAAGDSKLIVVSPEQGFGLRDEELVFSIPKSELPSTDNIESGDFIVAEDSDGEEADLRVVSDEGVVADAWGCGDVAAVPDLVPGQGVGGFCVPNAQHAVRQGKLLAKNLVADIRGEKARDYRHKNQGAVAGIGLYEGVFQSGPIAIKGFLAWVMHRGYHGFAMPMWERKIRVFGNWIVNFLVRRDLVGIPARDHPRAGFEAWAARPKPPLPEAP